MAEASVTFVDVGQGDCTVAADLRAGAAAVIDCPKGRTALAIEHLREQRISEVEMVVATHNDLDHLGGVYELAEQTSAREVRFNHGTVVPTEPREAVKLTAALRALAALSDRGVRLGPIVAGDSGHVGEVQWTVLAPDHGLITLAQGQRRPNQASVVMRLTIDSTRVLIGADAPATTWIRLLDDGTSLDAEVMLIPHHGAGIGDEALFERVLEAICAEYHVISVGTRNRYGHPAESVLRLLSERRARLMCTQVNEHCLGGADLPQKEAAALPQVSKIGAGLGAVGSCPCAGSVRVTFRQGAVHVTPSLRDHDRVVRALGNPYSRSP